MNKMDEQILVVPRVEVFENEVLAFQGVNSDKETVDKIMENISNHYSVVRRGDAEEDISYKQPIPYCLLKSNDKVFLYERLKGGGEKRLHNQLSVGLGGHMNQTDHTTYREVTKENLLRELEEELTFDRNQDFSIETVGLINDDENSVGKVHLGLLTIVNIEDKESIQVRETEQIKGEWVEIVSLKDPWIYDNLESWSQIVADIL